MQINIGLGLNEKFSQHGACTIASVLANADDNDSYHFYVIYDYLSEETIGKFEKLKKIRPCDIEYIPIDVDNIKDFTQYSNISNACFFRIKLFELENVDKILYLDSDIIVRKNIKPLFSLNIEKYCIAGAKDIIWKTLKDKYNLSEKSIYINTGVLLINIKKTRKTNVLQKIKRFCELHKDKDYGDQDIINYIFQEQILEFDIKYNFCYPFQNEYKKEKYDRIAEDPYIIHYITNNKPWNPGSTCFMKSEYFKYLKRTPYYKNFVESFQIDEMSKLFSKLNAIENKINELTN